MMSPRFCPHDVSDFWVRGQNLPHRIGKTGELRCGVNLLEELLNDWCVWIGEAQELVIITILVSATDSESKSFVWYWNVPSPIFRDDLVRLDSIFRQLLHQIFGQALAP